MPCLVARISEAFNNRQCPVVLSRVAVKCNNSLCPTLINPAEFPSICAWMCASGMSKLLAGAQPEHTPFFPIPCCAKELERTGWMGAPHHSSGSHACPLRLPYQITSIQPLWHIGKLTEMRFLTLYPRE